MLTYLRRIYGLKDPFEGQPVGSVTNNCTPSAHRPRIVPEQGHDHLNEAQNKPEPKLRIGEKFQLRRSTALEKFSEERTVIFQNIKEKKGEKTNDMFSIS